MAESKNLPQGPYCRQGQSSELVDTIEVSLEFSGTAQDKDGANAPYVAAEQAYKQKPNSRMTGLFHLNHVAGSLQLSLGALASGGPTNVPIPQPAGSDASLGGSQHSCRQLQVLHQHPL
ncbi:MAG: hypothetical protein R3D26_01965 [Cyanobacteriota/Melainabacteria group bacterium]